MDLDPFCPKRTPLRRKHLRLTQAIAWVQQREYDTSSMPGENAYNRP